MAIYEKFRGRTSRVTAAAALIGVLISGCAHARQLPNGGENSQGDRYQNPSNFTVYKYEEQIKRNGAYITVQRTAINGCVDHPNYQLPEDAYETLGTSYAPIKKEGKTVGAMLEGGRYIYDSGTIADWGPQPADDYTFDRSLTGSPDVPDIERISDGLEIKCGGVLSPKVVGNLTVVDMEGDPTSLENGQVIHRDGPESFTVLAE